MYLAETAIRNSCGHWDWERDELNGLEPGYRICQLCAELGPYEEKVRKQNRERSQDEYGVTFGWFPPREESDGH